MRILITNIILAERTGTEVVTLELARGLTRRGHQVAVFTPEMGPSAASLAADGIVVSNRIEDLPFKPDIIHGHHNLAVAPALARYPDVPALFVTHDAVQACDSPLLSPQIVRFFAVDEVRRQRALREAAAQTTRVDILPNAVDLERFKPRSALPDRPQRALLLAKQGNHIEAVQATANAAGLALDELGLAVGRVVDDLDVRLANYDLVFTSGRMAMEALAVGCAVVVCDGAGLAGLATTDQVDAWRHANFGRQILTRTPTVEALSAEMARYNALDAAAVSRRIRDTAALTDHLDRLEHIYLEITTNWTCSSDDLRRHSEALATFVARALREYLPAYKTVSQEHKALSHHHHALSHQHDELLQQHNALLLQYGAISRQLEAQQAIIDSRSDLLRQLWRVTTRKLRRARSPGPGGNRE